MTDGDTPTPIAGLGQTAAPSPGEMQAYTVMIEHATRCWAIEESNAKRWSDTQKLMLTVVATLFGLGLYKIEWVYGQGSLSRVPNSMMLYLIKGLMTMSLGAFAWTFIRTRRSENLPRVSKGWLAPSFGGMTVVVGLLAFFFQYFADEGIRSPSWSILGVLLIVIGGLTLASVGGNGNISAGARVTHKAVSSGSVSACSSHLLHYSNPKQMMSLASSNPLECQKLTYLLLVTAAADLRRRNANLKGRLRRSLIWMGAGISLVGFAVLLYIWSSVPPM